MFGNTEQSANLGILTRMVIRSNPVLKHGTLQNITEQPKPACLGHLQNAPLQPACLLDSPFLQQCPLHPCKPSLMPVSSVFKNPHLEVIVQT